MSNIFPQKELEQQLNYVTSIDPYSENQFSISVAVCDGKILEYSARDQELFDQEVERMSQYYNCEIVEEKERVYENGGKINISKEFKERVLEYAKEYFSTGNCQRELELFTNWDLINEMKNYTTKK